MLYYYLLAKYVDSKLRSGNKSMNDDELDSVLDNVLILFRYIQGMIVYLWLRLGVFHDL
jgi:cullin 4